MLQIVKKYNKEQFEILGNSFRDTQDIFVGRVVKITDQFRYI